MGYAPLAGTLFIAFPERRFARDAVSRLGLGFTNENLALPPHVYQVTLDGPRNFHDDPTPASVQGGAVTSVEMFLDG